MAIPTQKRLDRYFAELRKIEAHRSKVAENNIRKIYQEMAANLQGFLGKRYAEYAEDDKLTYSILARNSGYARFMEEVQNTIDKSTPSVKKTMTNLVEDMYETAYNGMLNAVNKAVDDKQLKELFSGISLTPAQVIKAAATNPITKLTLSDTLESSRKKIIHNINRSITIGLINGDRMSTMAKRISEDVNQNYRKAMLIARTEVHRVVEAGHDDATKEIDDTLKNVDSEFRMVKVWKTMDDSKVRKTNKANHRKMNNKAVLQDEEFDLGHGVKAKRPGLSGTAYNDCNCRCYASTRLMNDEEFFTASGRHFSDDVKPAETTKSETAKDTTKEEKIDKKMFPEKLAGVKRGEAMSFEKADNFNVNPDYGTDYGYAINCQTCVVGFEARQRGYDIKAKPNFKGSASETLSRKTNLAWIDPATGKHPEYIFNDEASTPSKYLKFMKEVIKKNERYTIEFSWKGRGNSGHIVNLDLNEKGDLRIKDNQRGKNERSEYAGDAEVLSYLKKMKYKTKVYGHEFSIVPKILRIDNMQFYLDVVNKILERI